MSAKNQHAIETVGRSGHFDAAWYVEQYPDVALLGMDPVEHYLWLGARLGRDPSPDFSSAGYLVLNPDVAAAGQNPLLHFLEYGIHEGRRWHSRHAPRDLPELGSGSSARNGETAEHRINTGDANLLRVIFDANWYAAAYPDVGPSGIDPWEHFQTIGWQDRRSPNQFFDASWYLMRNPDVAAAGVEPLGHYIKHGAAERRDPGPAFNSRFYAIQLAGDEQDQPNLLEHFLSAPKDRRLLASPADVSANAVAERLGAWLDLEPVTLHIGIVAYNQAPGELAELLRSCEWALRRAGTAVRSTLAVFDNGSTLREGNLPDGVVLLANGRNDGFGRAHNALMERAFAQGADVYLALNPDGAVHPDCLRNLLLMNQRHDGKALIEALQFPEEHPKFYDPESLETGWVSGACLLIPEKVWKATGGFDRNIFLYCEDVDLSWSARRCGFATLSCPTALFYHDVSDRPHSIRTWREMLIAGRYLAHKWQGDPAFTRFVEAEAVKAGFVNDARELPPLPANAMLHGGSGVGEWDYKFSFARTRW